MSDIGTVLRKELKESPFGAAGADKRGGAIIFAAFLILFGVIYPMSARVALFSGASFIFLVASGAFFAASAAADAYAGERERQTLETLLTTRLSDFSIALGKIGACTLFGWTASCALAILASVTVALGEQSWNVIPARLLASSVLFALFVNVLLAVVGVIASALSHTTRNALQLFTVVMMIIISGPAVAVRSNASFKREFIRTLAAPSSQNVLQSIVALVLVDTLLIGTALLICRRPVLLPSDS